MKQLNNYIGGTVYPAISGEYIDVYDPSKAEAADL